MYLIYSKFYEASNRPQNALIFYKNYIGLRGSLRLNSKEIKLANFESFYKKKLREEEIKTKKERLIAFQEKSKGRELWFYSILISSIPFLGVLVLYILRL